MTAIALFPSVLGVRPGIHAAADLIRSHGHVVHIVDIAEGRTFDDYDDAIALRRSTGDDTLTQRALSACADLPGPLVAMGFSAGGELAQSVALSRSDVVACILLGGVVDPGDLGEKSWPSSTAVQVHITVDDPWRDEEKYTQAALTAIRASGAQAEQFDYPGSGHLFTDASLLAEYQPVEAALLWTRVVDFLRTVPTAGSAP